MPGSNFYNALANARQQTEKLKQQKLAEINAASGALANERSQAADRQAKFDLFDRQAGLEREKMSLDSAARDRQFANALEIANISAGTRKDIAGEGNKTKLTIAEQNAQNRLDVEGTRQQGGYQRTQMQQEGANSRNDANRTTRESEGALAREHQKAMQERGLKSAEQRDAENNASRERIAQHQNELKAQAQQALEKHRAATLQFNQSNASMKQAWKEQMDQAEMEYKALRGQMMANEAVLSTPEQKQEMGEKFKALPGSLKSKSFSQPAQVPAGAIQNPDGSTFATPEQDATGEDMEPLVKSMAEPAAQPFGVMKSDRNTPAPAPQSAPTPMQPSNGDGSKVDPKSKEGRVARFKEIRLALARADKANKVPLEEIMRKDAAGEYDKAAREAFNAEGLATAKTKNNAVTGAPVDSPLEMNETTDLMGNTVEPSLSNIPTRLGRVILDSNKEAYGQLADLVTGAPMEASKAAISKIVQMMPNMSERERAQALAKIAELRGTKLSNLSNAATQTEARWAGLTQAAIEGGGLLLPKPISAGLGKAAGWAGPKLASKFPGLASGMKEAGGWIASKADDAAKVLGRDLTDLGGKKAAQEAASTEAEAAIKAETRAQAERMAARRAEQGAAQGVSNEADAVALNEQFYDDAYWNSTPEAQAVLKEQDFKSLFTKPTPPQSGTPWQMNAPQQPVVQVDPNTGVKMIVMDTPQGPKTLPISSLADDAVVPPTLPPGKINMVGPQADEVRNAAQMWENPANYPDPMNYKTKYWSPNAVQDQGLGAISPVDDQAVNMFRDALQAPPAGEPLPLDMSKFTPYKTTQAKGGVDFGLGKPTGGPINKRHAVLQQQVEGEKAMDAYRAMKETYVPSGAPEQPGLRGFAKEEMEQVFAPGNVVGAETPNITVAPAMQQAAKAAGIDPAEAFKMLHEVPIDQLPRGVSMETPEGASAFVKAILNYRTNKRISDFYANGPGYLGFTGGL